MAAGSMISPRTGSVVAAGFGPALGAITGPVKLARSFPGAASPAGLLFHFVNGAGRLVPTPRFGRRPRQRRSLVRALGCTRRPMPGGPIAAPARLPAARLRPGVANDQETAYQGDGGADPRDWSNTHG